MNIERMERLYNYVFSTKPDSEEREQRLNELSETDREQLLDYWSGCLSGRIKRAEESEDKDMDTTNMSYEEWKRLNKEVQSRSRGAAAKMMKFEAAHPTTAQIYTQKSLDDAQRRSEIMSIKDQHERWAAIQRNIDIF